MYLLIYCLMHSQQGKDKLAKLVRLEQQDLCDRLSSAQIQQALTADMDKLRASLQLGLVAESCRLNDCGYLLVVSIH